VGLLATRVIVEFGALKAYVGSRDLLALADRTVTRASKDLVVLLVQ